MLSISVVSTAIGTHPVRTLNAMLGVRLLCLAKQSLLTLIIRCYTKYSYSRQTMAQTLIEGVTRYWCRTQGIHYQDLTDHPQIDDVILLVNFIEEYQKDLKAKHRVQIYLYWDWCYKNRRPLQKKQLKDLLGVGERINYIRNLKQKKLNQSRQKIKATRRTIPA